MPCLTVLLALAGMAAADDDLKAAFTAEDVAALISARGHANQIQRDSNGDPLIQAVNPLIGHGYQILFYNCHGSAGCEAVQLRAWFTHKAPISADKMNAWNSEQTFGRVFVDADGDPTIDTFIYAHSGVPMAHVNSELTYFLKVMRDFHDWLGDSIE